MPKSHRAAGAATLAVAALAAAAPSAAQADAPYRYTAVDMTGGQANDPTAVAVAAGGKTVLFNAWADRATYSPQPLVRDVVGAKTTSLAGSNSWSIGYTDDLSKVLVSTSDRLDPADTNSYGDEYLIDRKTGKKTLLSRDWPSGEAYGGKYNTSAIVSGDGKVAYLSVWDWTGDSEFYRYDLTANTRTLLGKGIFGSYDTDTAGKVAILTDGALVDGTRRVPLPEGTPTVAADASVVLVKTKDGLTIVDLATGTQRAATLADFLTTNAYDVLGVASGGGTVYVGAVIGTGSTKKYAVATLNTATGALTVIRADIPWIPQARTPVLSPDLAYIAFATHVSPLFGSSVPGPEVAIPEVPNNEFILFYPGCSYGGLYADLIRPSVVLRGTSIGINGRKPTKADVTVTIDKTGAVANKFTMTAGQRRNLTAGWGGFTITSKIYYNDGKTTTGTRKVAPYTPIKHDYNPFNPGASICRQENGLY